jgi:hypothetical protein
VSLHRRVVLSAPLLAMSTLGTPARADASGAGLASYYERHMALVSGTAWGWSGRGTPRALMPGVVQVGVARERWFALRIDGSLVAWDGDAATAQVLMAGVASDSPPGESGWFAIDTRRRAVAGLAAARRRCAWPTAWPRLHRRQCRLLRHSATARCSCKGLAHRGQYGDGKLSATSPAFVPTARRRGGGEGAHTGHAIHLRRDGVVLGTGGNRFGPLSRHGLGDKADRWGPALRRRRGHRHRLAALAGDARRRQPVGLGRGLRHRAGPHHGARWPSVAAGDTATIARRCRRHILVAQGGGPDSGHQPVAGRRRAGRRAASTRSSGSTARATACAASSTRTWST